MEMFSLSESSSDQI